MPKNFKQWILAIILASLALSVVQYVLDLFKDPFPELTEGLREAERASRAFDRSLEELRKSEQEKLIIGTPTIGFESKIIGKWRLLGNPEGIDSTTEYFKDGTYLNQFKNATDSQTKSGKYKLIGGNKLKETWEECQGTCSQSEIVVEISFPDNNTMNVTYVEIGDILTYQRIDTER